MKYPLVRGRLIRLWRTARQTLGPVDAWASIQTDDTKRRDYQKQRGLGGFVRSTWDEVNEIIAAANAYTVKTHGPDRVIGFSPIPAMSMISYAAGSRYLSLIGGVCMSFYDWYCDLPPSSPQIWGEQTDVPESADWYNSTYILAWGSNVPQTRTPDAHFFTEVRYKGAKTVAITPDYSEVAKLSDVWLHPKQGTDAALGMAMGHVILNEFHVKRTVPYFDDYARRYTDMPLLVLLKKDGQRYVADRYVRADDFADKLAQANNPEWKTVAVDEASGQIVLPNGSIGFRWGESKDGQGKWNLDQLDARDGAQKKLALSLLGKQDAVAAVGFPYFGGVQNEFWANNEFKDVLVRNVPAKKLLLNGEEVLVATVFDLMCANYGVDRAIPGTSSTLGGDHMPKSYDDNAPYTPAWQQQITGVDAKSVITIAREFAENAEKTRGKSMVIIGAAMNHWYHSDMNYRAVINMLMMCGCIGQSGGGWAHYVGQEKLRPQTGWVPLAFATDWVRPPRQQNSTSFFYAHTDQWRYERLGVEEILSPLAEKNKFAASFIDFNARSERMGWLPSAPQLQTNPLKVCRDAAAAGMEPKDFAVKNLKSRDLKLSCLDPDNPANWPRNMFVWRSNILGSSGKGHEYFLKHLLGTDNGVMGKDLGEEGGRKPVDVVWHEQGRAASSTCW